MELRPENCPVVRCWWIFLWLSRAGCFSSFRPIGRDPDQIEDFWQVFYRGSFYHSGPILMSTITGVDQALWDIKGKRYGLPIYQLHKAMRR